MKKVLISLDEIKNVVAEFVNCSGDVFAFLETTQRLDGWFNAQPDALEEFKDRMSIAGVYLKEGIESLSNGLKGLAALSKMETTGGKNDN